MPIATSATRGSDTASATRDFGRGSVMVPAIGQRDLRSYAQRIQRVVKLRSVPEDRSSRVGSTLSSSMAAAGRASSGAGELAVANAGSDAADSGAAAVTFAADGAGSGDSLRSKSIRNGNRSLNAGEAAVMSWADDIGGASDRVDSTGNSVPHLEQFLAA